MNKVIALRWLRSLQGVPDHQRRRNRKFLLLPYEHDLGKYRDSAIAKKHGVRCSRVAGARQRRGITQPPMAIPPWLKELGKFSDEDIARRNGVHPNTVRKHRRKSGIARRRAPWISDLGTASDAEVAAKWGISRPNVTSARSKAGIPVFIPSSKVDWSTVDLRNGGIRAIALRIGVTSSAVSRARRRLGVDFKAPIQRKSSPRRRRPQPSKNLRNRVIDRDGMVCQICRGQVAPGDIHLDHIHPYALGGATTFENLRVTHSKCNMDRGLSQRRGKIEFDPCPDHRGRRSKEDIAALAAQQRAERDAIASHPLLGKVVDAELAAIFKTSQARVRNIRASLGIPPARKHRRAA